MTNNEAILSNHHDMTSFRYGDYNIRFRTPSILKRYTEIKEWDNGYIVVMADYEGIGLTEEYIDLVPILRNLYIDPDKFLQNIHIVKIGTYESWAHGDRFPGPHIRTLPSNQSFIIHPRFSQSFAPASRTS